MIVLFVLLLFESVAALDAPVHFSNSKKMTEEQFRKIPDGDPYSDPADDIPVVPPELLKPPLTVPRMSRKPAIDSQSLLPRDRYLEESKKAGTQMSASASAKRAHLWIDFESIHDHLIQAQAQPDATTRKPFHQPDYSRIQPQMKVEQANIQEKIAEFEPASFQLKSENAFRNYKYKPITWTTCEEFKSGSHLYDPNDIINIDWVPFYTWSSILANRRATLHQFQIPTQKMVYEYHTRFSKYLNRSVDWNQPKLYLNEDIGYMKALLIAADRTGLYFFIMDNDLPEYVQTKNIKLPLVTLRLKIVGDCLALMFCENNIAAIMARDGHVPQTNKDKRETSKMLKFKGKGRPVTRDINFERRRRKISDEKEKELADSKYVKFGPQPRERLNERKRKTKMPQEEIIIPDRALQ